MGVFDPLLFQLFHSLFVKICVFLDFFVLMVYNVLTFLYGGFGYV